MQANDALLSKLTVDEQSHVLSYQLMQLLISLEEQTKDKEKTVTVPAPKPMPAVAGSGAQLAVPAAGTAAGSAIMSSTRQAS